MDRRFTWWNFKRRLPNCKSIKVLQLQDGIVPQVRLKLWVLKETCLAVRVAFQTNDKFPRKMVSVRLATAKEGHPTKGNVKLILPRKICPTKLNVTNLHSQNLKILVTVKNWIYIAKGDLPQNEAKVSVSGCTDKGSYITGWTKYQKLSRLNTFELPTETINQQHI